MDQSSRPHGFGAEPLGWLLHWPIRVCEFLVTVVGLFLAATLPVAVLARYAFNFGFGWVDELCSLLLAWSMFLAAAVGFHEKIHIGMDILVDKLSAGAQRLLFVIIHLGTGAFFAVVGYYGIRVAAADMTTALATVPLPRGAFTSVIPVACALIVISCLNGALKALQGREQARTEDGVE